MLKKLIFWIRNHFGFSKTEAEGVVVLFLIIALALLSPLVVNLIYTSEKLTLDDQQRLDSLLSNIALVNSMDYPEKEKPINSKVKIQREIFDPNTASLDKLISLGINENISQRIIQYRQKGGKFRKPEDLKKMYGFPDQLYTEILPYISIKQPDADSSNDIRSIKAKNDPSPTKTDINMADSSTLVEIKGIGPYTAAKVIRYKEKLGGFIDTLQFYEIWGIDTIRAEILSKSVEITKDNIRKINLNKAREEDLYNHPYIDWKTAKLIVEYRNQHGPYKSVEELILIKTINQEWLQKIYPYLKIDSVN